MTKIAIAEYESDFSDAIMYVFANEPEINIVKTCNSGKELLQYISNNQVDVVLMDHRMPSINGEEATTYLKKAYSAIKVLILSYHINEKDVSFAMQAGADGYLSKNISKQEIMNAIISVKKDQTFFSEKVHQVQLRGKLLHETEGILKLTPREAEVLQLLGNGLSTKKIAELLFLGATTIDTHRKNIIKKFAAHNITEAVKKAALGGYTN